MAIIKGAKVVSDESAGLQNAAATPGLNNGDSDDNDILVGSLPAVFLGFGTAINAALSGYTGVAGNTGLDAFTVSPTGSGAITDVGFVGPTGSPLAGLDSGLRTLDGTAIFLYTDASNNNIVLGRVGNANGTADPGNDTANPLGTIAVAGYIQETLSGTGAITGGKIWLAQYQAIKHPTADPDEALNLDGKVYIGVSQDENFSLAGAPSGQQLFLMFTAEGATPVADRIPGVSIIVTGRNPLDQSASGAAITSEDTVNSSQGGGSTTLGTNNQSITEQEGLRFSFVTGAKADVTIPNLSPGEAGIEANIDFTQYFGARSATFQIVQETGGTTAMVRLTAFKNADNVSGSQSGVNFINSYSNDGAETVPIILSSITVKTFTGATVSGITITDNGGGSYTINGVPNNSQITYATATDHNRVLIENAGSLTAKNGDKTHADFDIGGFKVLQTSVDKLEIGSNMVFEDDGPKITLAETGTPDQLLVDESDLTIDATANFADNYTSTPQPGADGAGAAGTSTYVLGVSAAGADSGLIDVATGDKVLLRVNGDVVEGYTENGNLTVFTVSVSAGGLVELDQIRALKHLDPNNINDTVTLSAANLVMLTRTDTINDGDGDSNSGAATINIGQALVFRDDAPAITLGSQAQAIPALEVDETTLGTDATVANVALSGFFVQSPPLPGNDGASVASVYTIGLATGALEGAVIPGLVDVATNAPVRLFSVDASTVQGRTAAGDVVFTLSVSIDATGTLGSITLDQVRALSHGDTSDPNDAVQAVLADVIRVGRTDTITDADGDKAVSTVTTLVSPTVVFRDDGPSITVSDIAPADALTVDESAFGINATADFADNFSNTPNSYGNDGAGTISSGYALSVKSAGIASGLTDTETGESVVLSLNGTVVEGKTAATGLLVFTVSVSAAGEVTLDQSRAVVHPGTTDPNDSRTLAAADLIRLTRTDTITDKDGDSATSSDFIDIGQALNFEDDGPSITVSDIGPADALTVDESAFGINATADFADNFSNTPNSYGDDGAGTISSGYALSVKSAGIASGLTDTETGESVVLSLNGTVVEGKTAATGLLVFTVSVSAAGEVTLDQSRAVVHLGTTDPNDSRTLAAADLIRLTRTETITDKDGDSATSSDFIDIGQALNFEDDGPSITVSDSGTGRSLTVDETRAGTNATAELRRQLLQHARQLRRRRRGHDRQRLRAQRQGARASPPD